MKQSRFTDEQIIGFLKQADAGISVKELCRSGGFSQPNFFASCAPDLAAWGLPTRPSCESLKPVTTPVTSPQSNGMARSFVKTLKRDYAKLANRPVSKTVMAQLKDWFDDYKSYHPHSALDYLPPTLFMEK
jgi:transposase InsO family protein